MIGRAEIGDYEDEAAEHFDGVALPNAHFVCHLRQPILGMKLRVWSDPTNQSTPPDDKTILRLLLGLT